MINMSQVQNGQKATEGKKLNVVKYKDRIRNPIRIRNLSVW